MTHTEAEKALEEWNKVEEYSSLSPQNEREKEIALFFLGKGYSASKEILKKEMSKLEESVKYWKEQTQATRAWYVSVEKELIQLKALDEAKDKA